MNKLKQLMTIVTTGALLLCIPAQSDAYVAQISKLMASPSFKEDARLSNVLYQYFLLNSNARIRTGLRASELRQEGFDIGSNAEYWVNYVQPQCERLTETYEDVIVVNVDDMTYNDQMKYAELSETFRETFDTSVFKECRAHAKLIDEFNSSDVGIKYIMPRLLKQYTQDYGDVANGNSDISLAKALTEQNSGRYRSRINQGEDIRVLLDWLDVIGDDPVLLKEWRAQYQKVKSGWDDLMQENAANSTIIAKSRFSPDVYKKADGDDVRASIALHLNKKYGLKVHSVIVRGNAKRLDLKRLTVVDGKLVGEDYSSIAFYAVLDQGNERLSSHRGWYEEVNGKSAPEVFLYAEDENVKKPRLDQLVSTAKQATVAEKRAANSARIEAEVAESNARVEAQVAQEVAAAKRAADEESARLLADAQSQIDAAQQRTSASSFSLLGLISATLLLLGGVICAAPFISTKLPESAVGSFQNLLDKIAPFKGLLGFALLGLGLFGLVLAVVALAPLAIAYALVCVASGAVLSEANVLSETQQTAELITKVQRYSMPVVIVAIICSLLSLIGVL